LLGSGVVAVDVEDHLAVAVAASSAQRSGQRDRAWRTQIPPVFGPTQGVVAAELIEYQQDVTAKAFPITGIGQRPGQLCRLALDGVYRGLDHRILPRKLVLTARL